MLLDLKHSAIESASPPSPICRVKKATILQQFGIDHERFTYRYHGLDQKLTGVEKATPVKALVA